MKERASNWDQPVSDYIHMSEQYLGFQHPGSVYAFSDAGGSFKRVCFFNLSRNDYNVIFCYKKLLFGYLRNVNCLEQNPLIRD